MARPQKNGLDYFPFDVGLFHDKKVKLIKGEFGTNGVLILIYLFCSIYEENGYFKKWSKDDSILVSDEIGCGCSSGTIAEVVKGCLRRSLFDKDMFDKFSILTSSGIQRRFIRAASQREDIQIIQEYWLLNMEDKKDVPLSVFNKISFKSISTSGSIDKTNFNGVKTYGNHKSKVKESKEKEINTTPLPPSGEQEEIKRETKKSENKDKLNKIWSEHRDRLSSNIRKKILEWIEYKKEKGKSYKPKGLNSLLVQLEKKLKIYDESVVIEIIDESMASNYQGILWDKLRKGGNEFGSSRTYSNVEKLDSNGEKSTRQSFGTIL